MQARTKTLERELPRSHCMQVLRGGAQSLLAEGVASGWVVFCLLPTLVREFDCFEHAAPAYSRRRPP